MEIAISKKESKEFFQNFSASFVPELPDHVFVDIYRDAKGVYYPFINPNGKMILDLRDHISEKP